jgi:hypothetical protein
MVAFGTVRLLSVKQMFFEIVESATIQLPRYPANFVINIKNVHPTTSTSYGVPSMISASAMLYLL